MRLRTRSRSHQVEVERDRVSELRDLLGEGDDSAGVSGYVRSHRRVLKLDGLVRADTGLRDLEAD